MTNSKRSQMLEHLRVWQREGGSLRGYAQSRSVPYSQLTYWRKRLVTELEEPDEGLELVELHVTDEKPAEDRIEVRLSSGRVIRVPQGFNDGDLHRLIGVLESC